MYILSIACYYHDSSACLVKDGKLLSAAQEERFTRKKHDTDFPIQAIQSCLDQAGINIDQVDHVAFYEKPLLKFERLLYQHLEVFPKSYSTFLSSLPSWINQKLRVPKILKKKLKYKGDIFFIPHHMSHAASFLLSPFDKASILTVDGVGEWTTTAHGVGEGKNIILYQEIKFPHSLGLLYSTITAYLGFSVNNSEYKVMGLSPYGSPDTYYDQFKQIVDIKEDGSFWLNMEYFVYHYKSKMPSQKLCQLLGGPIRKPDDQLTQRHKDVAAVLQRITEEIIFKILNHIHQKDNLNNLVISGGCGLNSVANGKILQNTPFRNIWLQPDPGDGGTSLGAAYYVYNTILDNPKNFEFKSPYLGPGYTTQEIKEFLDKHNIKYSTFENDTQLIQKTAQLIHQNNVIGWFHHRMEWGPRALGARSILSNPTNLQMQEILNLKVKHREKFRPFAPVVCEDDANQYFKCDQPAPVPTDYMLIVYPIRPEFHSKIPAVTHVDGSGRLQTIRRDQNPLYYDLIKEFGKLSGIPILINTSFNIRGEPIVCTPLDAYRCMMGTGIDYLVIGKFLVKREDNPQDIWDSEKLAKD